MRLRIPSSPPAFPNLFILQSSYIMGAQRNQTMIKSVKTLAKILFALAVLVNVGVALAQTPPSSADKKRLERFEKEVDDLRARLKIPGLSAVIVKDQKVLWAKGFGFADLEKQ